MIFGGKKYDESYLPWFAWHPVKLYGPDEWDRAKKLRRGPRWVWLRYIARRRMQPRPYYRLLRSTPR